MSVEDIIRAALEGLQRNITERQRKAGAWATGRTAGLYEVRVRPDGGELWGAAYAGVLERGRRPGKVPYNFEALLRRWAEAKGITFADERDAMRWARAVAWKIRREGTELYRTGGTRDIFTTPIQEMTDRLVKDLGAFYEAEIKAKIFE